MVPGQTLQRKVDGIEFVITGDGKTATINGFLVTRDEYSKALKGKKVTLKAKDGKEAVLDALGDDVMFNGQSFSNGMIISMVSKYAIPVKTMSSQKIAAAAGERSGHITALILLFTTYSQKYHRNTE